MHIHTQKQPAKLIIDACIDIHDDYITIIHVCMF